MITDKQVRKENKRRNINLDGDIYQDQLFNFTPNFSFQHILEIYGINNNDLQLFNSDNNFKNSGKLNDDIMMHNNISNFEDMSTFPQTYDPNMNFDMQLEEVDTSLDLRRR
jgi:hypothetical protein